MPGGVSRQKFSSVSPKAAWCWSLNLSTSARFRSGPTNPFHSDCAMRVAASSRARPRFRRLGPWMANLHFYSPRGLPAFFLSPLRRRGLKRKTGGSFFIPGSNRSPLFCCTGRGLTDFWLHRKRPFYAMGKTPRAFCVSRANLKNH